MVSFAGLSTRIRDARWIRPVDRDHWQTPAQFRRRQAVSAATLAVGGPVLRQALRQPSGSRAFQGWTVALAGVWTVGAFASGPLYVGRSPSAAEPVRPFVRPVLVGMGATALFTVGGMVVVQVPALRGQIEGVVRHARQGDLRVVMPLTLVTGAAEELFFRGGLYAAVPQPHQVAVTTAVYGCTTLFSGNPMLVFASGVLGVITGEARRVTGGVVSPVIIHAVWSAGMLQILPRLTQAAAGWGESLLMRYRTRAA